MSRGRPPSAEAISKRLNTVEERANHMESNLLTIRRISQLSIVHELEDGDTFALMLAIESLCATALTNDKLGE